VFVCVAAPVIIISHIKNNFLCKYANRAVGVRQVFVSLLVCGSGVRCVDYMPELAHELTNQLVCGAGVSCVDFC
jgi:uncharacterized membrane protein (DUF441 family)